MSEKINLTELRRNIVIGDSDPYDVNVRGDIVLALVEAVEAAHRVHVGWESGSFDMNDLAAALERFELEAALTPPSATLTCECGHDEVSHWMQSQQQRCRATVYTNAPLGGGSAYPCPCRQFACAEDVRGTDAFG